jgi:hypothetical protein
MQHPKTFILLLLLVIGLYLAGPIVAGTLGAGDREGPIIYPAELHATLFGISYETTFHEKPRERADGWMYDRPYFYGQPRRLKTAADRAAFIDKAAQFHNPRLVQLIEMNRQINGPQP